jgi:maleamate amidohydrolase
MSFKDILTEEDRKAFEKGSYGNRMGYGMRPALLVIDVTYSFVDPLYAQAYGDMGWKAVEALKRLVPLCRSKGVPILYTVSLPKIPSNAGHQFGISRKKSLQGGTPGSKEDMIIEEIAPRKNQDLVIYKTKASGFFNTDLISVLTFHKVDTLIITGATTSGCVRATVVDGASYGFYVIIPEEAVTDRAVLSHKVNLLDMDMKYADVEPLENVLGFLQLQKLQDKKGE